MRYSARQVRTVLYHACANLRRAARAVTRWYNRELQESGLEMAQFTLLMALDLLGETTQGQLAQALSLDSTTLTRTLSGLRHLHLLKTKAGSDRRQKRLSLTKEGRRKLELLFPLWHSAQSKLQARVSPAIWQQLERALTQITAAATER